MAEELTSTTQFLLQEYTALRGEVAMTLQEAYSLEKFALAGAAGITAYLITNRERLPRLAWWLPFGFLSVCGIRFAACQWHVLDRVQQYLMKTERTFLASGAWEEYFRTKPANQTIAHALVWGGALLATFIVAVYYTRRTITAGEAAHQFGPGAPMRSGSWIGIGLLVGACWLLTPLVVDHWVRFNYFGILSSDTRVGNGVPAAGLRGAEQQDASTRLEQRGQFGDQFGAAGSLFSALSIILVIISLSHQRTELREQRLASRAQQAEATFTQLITWLRSNATWIVYHQPGAEKLPEGREAMRAYKHDIEAAAAAANTPPHQHMVAFYQAGVLERLENFAGVFQDICSFLHRIRIERQVDERTFFIYCSILKHSMADTEKHVLDLYLNGIVNFSQIKPKEWSLVQEMGLLA